MSLAIWMKIVFCCFIIFTLYIIVLEFMLFIQNKKIVLFLGANFLFRKSGSYLENQPVIGLVIN